MNELARVDLLGAPMSTPTSPVDLPLPPDLSHLPPHVLHAGTIETLIGQNEDLMARLKVNLRRNGLLEQQIMTQQKSNDELMRSHDSLMSQIQLLEEKDILQREKLSRSEAVQADMTSEIELCVKKIDQLLAKNKELESYSRALRRIRRWVAPLVEKLTQETESAKKTLLTKEAHLSDLRARLQEAVRHAQEIERRATKDQAQIVDQYEKNQSALTNEIEKLRQETKPLREKAARIDQALKAEADSANRIVFLERQNQELQKSADSFRKEAKTLAAEALTRKTEMEDLTRRLEEAVREKERTQDQFESLQAVWSEAQKRLEAAKLQQDTLNRLNQELSRQLKEQRIASVSEGPQANC